VGRGTCHLRLLIPLALAVPAPIYNLKQNFGVDVNNGGVCNTFESFVWEPALVKINAIQSATEAACLILSVDETVRNPASEAPDAAAMGAGRGGMGGRGGGGRGRGRGMRR
jgi:T-complex protein 1 subunit eta